MSTAPPAAPAAAAAPSGGNRRASSGVGSRDRDRDTSRQGSGASPSPSSGATLYGGAGGGSSAPLSTDPSVMGSPTAWSAKQKALLEHNAQSLLVGSLGNLTLSPKAQGQGNAMSPTRGSKGQGHVLQSEREKEPEPDQISSTAEALFEEEEELLNMHMAVIQETAELLTQEGQLLQGMQGDTVIDGDIDTYAIELEKILTRKLTLVEQLQGRLGRFKEHLAAEEAQWTQTQSHAQSKAH